MEARGTLNPGSNLDFEESDSGLQPCWQARLSLVKQHQVGLICSAAPSKWPRMKHARRAKLPVYAESSLAEQATPAARSQEQGKCEESGTRMEGGVATGFDA